MCNNNSKNQWRSDENEYWRECAIAAQFQPIEIDDVPRTRGEVQKYFDDWRDRLASSEAAMYNIDFILDGMRTVFTALPTPMRLAFGPFVRAGVVATYPRWMRSMMGVRQSRVTDALVTAAIRPAMSALAKSPRAQVWFLNRIAPRGGPVLEGYVRGMSPESPSVYKPAEARRKFGDPRSPLEQYADLLAARQQGSAPAPYEHNHRDDLLEFATPAAKAS